MYFLTCGPVHVAEFEVDNESGELGREIALFSASSIRTSTAICAEAGQLQRLSRDRVRELVFKNPSFAFHLLDVVTTRLENDLRMVEERGGRPRVGG